MKNFVTLICHLLITIYVTHTHTLEYKNYNHSRQKLRQYCFNHCIFLWQFQSQTSNYYIHRHLTISRSHVFGLMFVLIRVTFELHNMYTYIKDMCWFLFTTAWCFTDTGDDNAYKCDRLCKNNDGLLLISVNV